VIRVQPPAQVVAFEPSLGRDARIGSWEDLAKGTFRVSVEKLEVREFESAATLVEISVLEAEELRDVYERWPTTVVEWIKSRGVLSRDVDRELERLTGLIGETAMDGIAAEWPQFLRAVDCAAELCRSRDSGAVNAIEAARVIWLGIHDRAVDRLSGLIDIAVRMVGESSLGDLWNFLMDEWYPVHARYSLSHQAWSESAHQLMIAIVDGFHAHLAGPSRQGDIELIEEEHRIGFRFAPCGSGGRSVDRSITDGSPLAGPPYDFAVTTEPHDWAWNTRGICSYCVHCCLLNELIPIDRLGYPTRVIDPPTWPNDGSSVNACTWWVYKHPSLVPDSVYLRVGRSPVVRPDPE